MRYSQSGTAVASLRLATDRRRQNGDTEADWHSVVCWGKQAEAVAEYVKKGQPPLRRGLARPEHVRT